MESTGTSHSPASVSRARHWLRVLRPLIWWLGFVLILFAIRTHLVLSEGTRLRFSATLPGKAALLDATASIGQERVVSGGRVRIGWRTFTASHPKAEPFKTNLFIWYGEQDLGEISLKRAKGILELQTDFPAPLLTIQGPEFSQTWSNVSKLSVSLPTDAYSIEAKYSHWQQRDEIMILNGLTTPWQIAPRFGSLSLSCNRAGASFELLSPDNQMVEAGGFPANITQLPEGMYTLVAQHLLNKQEEKIVIKRGTTNAFPVEWVYGSAVISTEPAGAAVLSGDGRDWGITPLTLKDLPVGIWRFTLRHEGYEPSTLELEIASNQTNTFHTNLTGRNYTGAMKSAEQYFGAGEFAQAIEAVGEALLAKSNDPVALELKRQATGFASLRRAERLGKQGDYIAGVTELEKATKSLPENAEAIQLLVDFKQRAPAQEERKRFERVNRGKRVFDSLLLKQPDAELFETHELKTSKPVRDVEAALLAALKSQPAFKILRQESTAPETFEIEAVQELSTYLATSAGRRVCVIVGAQTQADETEIRFKVLEYKAEAVNKLSLGAWIGAPMEVKYVPVHASRMARMTEGLKQQVAEGVSNVTARIEWATGQTAVGK